MHFAAATASGFLAMVGFASLLANCDKPPPARPGEADGTAPAVRLGSAGLRSDFALDEMSTAEGSRRSDRTGLVLLGVSAKDNESGMANLRLDGDLVVECIPTASNRILRIRDPIAVA